MQLIWICTNIANSGDERICRSKLVSNQNDLQAGFPHLSKQQLLIGLKWGDEWTYCGSGITWQGMPCTWAPPPTPGFSQKYNFELSDYRDASQELGEVFAKSLEDQVEESTRRVGRSFSLWCENRFGMLEGAGTHCKALTLPVRWGVCIILGQQAPIK